MRSTNSLTYFFAFLLAFAVVSLIYIDLSTRRNVVDPNVVGRLPPQRSPRELYEPILPVRTYTWQSLRAQNELRKLIFETQNPPRCKGVKYLECELPRCGFGCQLHTIAGCLYEAVATNMVMVVNFGYPWWYQPQECGDVQMDCYFLPISHCNNTQEMVYDSTVTHRMSSKDLAYFPDTIIKNVTEFHPNPMLWVIGHMLEYILRPRPEVLELFSALQESIGFKRPVFGLHVRGTDMYREAIVYSLDEYMLFVNRSWPRIFLASEDQGVRELTTEIKDRTWLMIQDNVRVPKPIRNRLYKTRLLTLIMDMFMLMDSDHFIGGDSSQVSKAVYELRQTLYVDGSKSAWSIHTIIRDGKNEFFWYFLG